MFRVVTVPEKLEKLRVGYHSRVVVNLQRFSMIAEIMIGGAWFFPARIAYSGSDNSRDTPEPGVGAPESAQGKSGSLGLGWNLFVHGWDHILCSGF